MLKKTKKTVTDKVDVIVSITMLHTISIIAVVILAISLSK